MARLICARIWSATRFPASVCSRDVGWISSAKRLMAQSRPVDPAYPAKHGTVALVKPNCVPPPMVSV
jgi:hypothetical protein